MKSLTITFFAMGAALTAMSEAAVIVVNPSDITFASAQTTTTTTGTITRANSDQFEIRTRPEGQVDGGDGRTVATFANFDISSIAPGATINSATLSATYDSRLNTVNATGPGSVGAVTQAWNTSGTLNPLFRYGDDNVDGTLDAINNQVLVADILNTDPVSQTVTGDFTSTIQGWLDSTLDNNGLVFFIDGFGSQGAGFNGVSISIDYTPIPEPSTGALLAIAVAGMFGLRRRR